MLLAYISIPESLASLGGLSHDITISALVIPILRALISPPPRSLVPTAGKGTVQILQDTPKSIRLGAPQGLITFLGYLQRCLTGFQRGGVHSLLLPGKGAGA